MKAIAIENPGKEYRLVVADIPTPKPKAGEVLIKVSAAGLNHADMAQGAGRYPPPPGAPDTLGMEASGEIVEIGAGVTNYKIGDKVCALMGGGGYAEYAVASEKCLLPIPKGVSIVDAAALPEVYFTVWTNLIDSARLKPGETVLIHGGTSGIGTAAIQLCVARGHKVFSTAANAEKCSVIEKLGGRAINYKEQDFVEVVKKVSGVDFPVTLAERRPGDPASLIARADRIRAELGWQPEHDDLEKIVGQALAWEDKLRTKNATT